MTVTCLIRLFSCDELPLLIARLQHMMYPPSCVLCSPLCHLAGPDTTVLAFFFLMKALSFPPSEFSVNLFMLFAREAVTCLPLSFDRGRHTILRLHLFSGDVLAGPSRTPDVFLLMHTEAFVSRGFSRIFFLQPFSLVRT